MTSSRVVLGLAVLATVGLVAAGPHGSETAALWGGLAGNFVIPALWAAVMLTHRRPSESALAAAATIVVVAMVAGGRGAAIGSCFLASGAAGGWAMRRTWRVLPVIALAALWLVPVFFVELGGTSVVEAAETLSAENRRVFAESLPPELSEADRGAALADFDAMTRRVLAVQRTLWPSLVTVGLLTQAALALWLGWAVARITVGSPPRPRVRPWETWRAPFFSVWTLIGGLALTITTVQPLVVIGWNVVLLSGLLLAVQGLAVQTWLVRRALPPVARALFWIVGAIFLGPLLVASGALTGLVDQWWDLRRDRADSAPDGDDET